MKVTVACDICKKVIPVEEAQFDVGNEWDLCPEHFKEQTLIQAKQKRAELATWLENTHLKNLRELDELIAELEKPERPELKAILACGYDSEAQVTRSFGLGMQVCVPADMTEERIIEFSQYRNPCGTEGGWHIRKEGDLLADWPCVFLEGQRERMPCSSRPGFVHVILDA
jgi:hypothetical protein